MPSSFVFASALVALLVTPVHAQSPAEDLLFLRGTAVPDAELHGGYPAAHDARGISVACSADGTTAIVGAMRDGARIFTHGDDGWILDHEIRPPSAPRPTRRSRCRATGPGGVGSVVRPPKPASGSGIGARSGQ